MKWTQPILFEYAYVNAHTVKSTTFRAQKVQTVHLNIMSKDHVPVPERLELPASFDKLYSYKVIQVILLYK